MYNNNIMFIGELLEEAVWLSGLEGLELKSVGPWFNYFSLSLSGFVLGSPKFNSLITLCK